MHGTKSEVDQFLGVPDGPFSASAAMAVVSSGYRVASAQRLGKCLHRYAARPAAVTHLFIFSVPAGSRKPHFELDFGIACGPRGGFDIAVRRDRGSPDVGLPYRGGRW